MEKQDYLPGFAPERRCKCAFSELPHFWGKVSEHPLRGVYGSMLTRCYNPRSKSYVWYGARGISVCAEWRCSRVFIAWAEAAGYQAGLQLERKDNDAGYSPGNCVFATVAEQALNKRSNRRLPDGRLLRDAAKAAGLTFQIVRTRIDYLGWSVERALSERVTVPMGVVEAAKAAGVSRFTVYRRISLNGMSLIDAVAAKPLSMRRKPAPKPNSFTARCRAVGLSPQTVRGRMAKGLSFDEAMSADFVDNRNALRPESIAGRARAAGLSYATVYGRLVLGWSLADALSPEGSERTLKYRARPDSIAARARLAGIDPARVRQRVKAGWPLDRALSEPLRPGRSRRGER